MRTHVVAVLRDCLVAVQIKDGTTQDKLLDGGPGTVRPPGNAPRRIVPRRPSDMPLRVLQQQ